MHSHDRTLLASLGFADPDKRNPLHDFACQYLALRENHERIAGMAAPLDEPKKLMLRRKIDGCQWEFDCVKSERLDLGDPTLEFPVHKGEGKYKTSVGFVDVFLPCDIDIEHAGTVRRSDEGKTVSRPHVERHVYLCAAFVEVKIGRVSAGEVLRQVGLYREYIDNDEFVNTLWLLATPYAIDRTDKHTLESAGIRHILLGEKFQRWAAERQSAPAFAESDEL